MAMSNVDTFTVNFLLVTFTPNLSYVGGDDNEKSSKKKNFNFHREIVIIIKTRLPKD